MQRVSSLAVVVLLAVDVFVAVAMASAFAFAFAFVIVTVAIAIAIAAARPLAHHFDHDTPPLVEWTSREERHLVPASPANARVVIEDCEQGAAVGLDSCTFSGVGHCPSSAAHDDVLDSPWSSWRWSLMLSQLPRAGRWIDAVEIAHHRPLAHRYERRRGSFVWSAPFAVAAAASSERADGRRASCLAASGRVYSAI